MADNIKRAIAYKVPISEINSGEFVTSAGEYIPAYVKTRSGMELSRVNVIARILEADNNNYVADDGSDVIKLVAFSDGALNSLKKDDIVRLIGKPRELGGERVLSVEAAKVLDGEQWLKLRQVELERGNVLLSRKGDKEGSGLSIDEMHL